MVRGLVEDTQDAYDPRNEDYERVLTKLRAASASSANRGRLGFGRWGLGLLATGALLVGAVLALRQTRVEPQRASILPTENRAATTESPPPLPDPNTPTVSVEALPSVAPSGQARASRSIPQSNSAPESTLAEEIRLLRAANDASRASNHADALALVEEHEHRFPKGFLADERRVQKILTLCDLGRKERARSEATRFSADRPTSPLNMRLSSSCAGEQERQDRQGGQ